MRIFQAATRCTPHDGLDTLFWEDRWFDGRRIQEVAPVIYSMVPSRVRRTSRLGQVVTNGSWADCINPDLGMHALQEYLELWHRVQAWEPTETGPDVFTWSWEANGQYSVRSAYAAKFWGREVIPTTELTWKSRAPSQCKFFTWLALRNKCWTSDRLSRRGLPHQDKCPLCDQEEETIDHVLLACVFAMTMWAAVCTTLVKPEWMPTPQDSLQSWLCTKQRMNTMATKDLHAILLLALWELWKHRNAIVFDGARPSIDQLLQRVRDEGVVWSSAGLLKGNVTSFFSRVERWVSGED